MDSLIIAESNALDGAATTTADDDDPLHAAMDR